jgi:hypothetical protein
MPTLVIFQLYHGGNKLKNKFHFYQTPGNKTYLFYKTCVICTNKRKIKMIKTYYLELMLSIYIVVYNEFLLKKLRLHASPATFINKSDKLLTL